MDIKVFVWEGYLEDKFSMKIIDLIKSASLHYTLLPLKKMQTWIPFQLW